MNAILTRHVHECWLNHARYDANGNTLSDAQGRQYTWDFENRLTQVVNPGVGTTTFRYDPFGRRIQKSGPLGTTNYLYDGNDVLGEIDPSGNILARYTHGDETDQPLAGLRSGNTSYYQQDVLDSITSLSNPSGALTNTYTYDTFGRQTASTGTLTNPLRYTGREWDTETNLQFSRARYFDPDTGRFLSEDPWNFYAGDPNFYRYVANDPTDFIDPSGNKIVPSPGPGAGGGINIFNYQTAIAYLKGDPSCGAVINKLENSPRTFTLEFIHNGNEITIPIRTPSTGIR